MKKFIVITLVLIYCAQILHSAEQRGCLRKSSRKSAQRSRIILAHTILTDYGPKEIRDPVRHPSPCYKNGIQVLKFKGAKKNKSYYINMRPLISQQVQIQELPDTLEKILRAYRAIIIYMSPQPKQHKKILWQIDYFTLVNSMGAAYKIESTIDLMAIIHTKY